MDHKVDLTVVAEEIFVMPAGNITIEAAQDHIPLGHVAEEGQDRFIIMITPANPRD